MDPERWARIKKLFQKARGRPPDEREAVLAAECHGDEALRQEVRDLLAQTASTADIRWLVDSQNVALGLDGAPQRASLTGTHIGPYHVGAMLGAGAMGEVYRARDTKLERDVAIKVLHGAFAADTELRRRLAREARILASLNHPNIAAIYGLEESDGPALVLELVEGETLSERLARGRPPVATALNFARQIVEALDAAHSRGIIHRDLKPANITITPDGIIKVLDLGIAKAVEGDQSHADVASSGTPSTSTRTGVVGTAAYMSPEQARGDPVDKRCDIWAFGCVLYEMLTGRRAYGGDHVRDVAGGPGPGRPDMGLLPPETPVSVRRLLNRCLEPDLKHRLRDIADAWGDIQEADVPQPSRNGAWQRHWLRRSAIPASVLLALVIGLAIALLWRPPSSDNAIGQFVLTPPEQVDFGGGAVDRAPAFAISPDGRRVAFVATDRTSGQRALWVRQLGSLYAEALSGTEGAMAPFWKPDGNAIGFFADEQLKKVGLDRTPPIALARSTGPLATGTWSTRGVIVYSTGTRGSLLSVSENGGPSQAVTDPRRDGHFGHVHPRFLPDGTHFLFLALADDRGVYVASIEAPGSTRILTTQDKALYAPPGYLLFLDDGRLRAQRFDPERLTLSGDEIPVVDSVAFVSVDGRASFDVSASGTLLYRVGGLLATSQPVWFDRSGQRLGSIGDPGDYQTIGISRDGSRVAAELHDLRTAAGDLWLLDLRRGGSPAKLTFDGRHHHHAVWSPRDDSIVFSGVRPDGSRNLYLKSIGSDVDEPLLPPGSDRVPTDWSGQNGHIVFQELDAITGLDLWTLNATSRVAAPFLRTKFQERGARFSPDGRFIAYVSDESGRAEVYVRPFNDKAPKVQVSFNGGRLPRWTPDGRELFFFAPDNSVQVVPVRMANTRTFDEAQRLFAADIRNPCAVRLPCAAEESWEVTDGRRFLINVNPPGPNPPALPINVVLNWSSLLQAGSN
jgi:serine/threonine protein kinase/Tol biopolymer transport system component